MPKRAFYNAHIAIICGGRDFKPTLSAAQWLSYVLVDRSISRVYHGGARGADLFGRDVARSLDIPSRAFIPQWDQYGKRAGLARNREMVLTATDLVGLGDVTCAAFPGGRGTAHMVGLCEKYKIEVIHYEES